MHAPSLRQATLHVRREPQQRRSIWVRTMPLRAAVRLLPVRSKAQQPSRQERRCVSRVHPLRLTIARRFPIRMRATTTSRSRRLLLPTVVGSLTPVNRRSTILLPRLRLPPLLHPLRCPSIRICTAPPSRTTTMPPPPLPLPSRPRLPAMLSPQILLTSRRPCP